MAKRTPRQEAAYALDWDLDPADLSPSVRAEYHHLKQERLTNPAAGREAGIGQPREARQWRVYRMQRWLRLGLWIPVLLFVGFGAGFLADEAETGVFGVALGIVMLIFGAYFAAVLATDRLIAGPGGLVSWRFLRRRSMEWSSVRSFEIAWYQPRLSPSGGDAVYICLDSERVATVIQGSGRFMTRVVGELRDWQRRAQAAEGAVKRDDTSAAPG